MPHARQWEESQRGVRMSMRIHTVDGVKYFETKTVTFKGKEYKELKSTDVTKPSVLYGEVIDGKFTPLKDGDTVYALSVKYAMCVLSLHGYPIMDYALMLDEDEFTIENGKLVILNGKKREIFDRHIKK